MPINLYDHQKKAIEELKTGSILCGGVGSGKSRTALAYFYIKECKGKIKINGEGGYSPMKKPKDLYIITTARKRDTLEWEKECLPFSLSTNKESSVSNIKVTVDSWNNIKKYIDIKNSFFIFDEQKVVGSGLWVKSFLKITKKNNWILLSATPGDTWSDYIPVFIANGFYKNRTEFSVKHIVYNRFCKFPKIDRYVECSELIKHKNEILVNMAYKRPTTSHIKDYKVYYDKTLMDEVLIKRWNPFENEPVKDISSLCQLMRKVSNIHESRIEAVKKLLKKHDRIIVFYNFNYELELLRKIEDVKISEYNGKKHDPIPKEKKWLYLVQYNAGSEGWNCIETNAIIFFSQNYSYKIMEQARGRIDRLNTPYSDLYYYILKSDSIIDLAISKCIKKKKDFNENKFMDI